MEPYQQVQTHAQREYFDRLQQQFQISYALSIEIESTFYHCFESGPAANTNVLPIGNIDNRECLEILVQVMSLDLSWMGEITDVHPAYNAAFGNAEARLAHLLEGNSSTDLFERAIEDLRLAYDNIGEDRVIFEGYRFNLDTVTDLLSNAHVLYGQKLSNPEEKVRSFKQAYEYAQQLSTGYPRHPMHLAAYNLGTELQGDDKLSVYRKAVNLENTKFFHMNEVYLFALIIEDWKQYTVDPESQKLVDAVLSLEVDPKYIDADPVTWRKIMEIQQNIPFF